MKICIDAGHYGKYNQSPVNRAYYESDFSWRMHLYLKAELEKYGIAVITTRPDQAHDLALESRGKKAAGCDLFLSVHSNACNYASVDYPLACCTVSGKADRLGQQLAGTVADVMQTEQNGRIIKRTGSGGADYYGVLRGAASVGVPGILLEHSFHTNLRATNWLLDEDNCRRMAEAEAAVIAAYYGLSKQDAQPAPVSSEPDSTSAPAEPPTPKPMSELVQEILRGDWGNGDERKRRLTAAGYNYSVVQAAVNKAIRKASGRIHTVAPGDTLTKIARAYGTSISAILRDNADTYPAITANHICVGWKLKV